MDGRKLLRVIRLERGTKAQDEYGEEVLTWATLATVRASFRPVSDGERMAAQEVSADLTARFQIRRDSLWADLNAQDRLVFDGRIYSISGVKELGRREGLEITAAVRNDILVEDDTPPTDGPSLIFSIATNSQYIGQVV